MKSHLKNVGDRWDDLISDLDYNKDRKNKNHKFEQTFPVYL